MLIVYNSSVMDFSKRLTDNARDVLAHAEVLARVSGSPYIGTEHLLLGILSQENSVGAHILRNAGVQFDRVKSALSLVTTANSNGTLTPTKGFSETAKLTLRMSIELASEFHQDYCGTEHILFSLLNQTNARAATVLSDLNIDTKSIISDDEVNIFKNNSNISRGIVHLLLMLACHDWRMYVKYKNNVVLKAPELIVDLLGSREFRYKLIYCRYFGWSYPIVSAIRQKFNKMIMNDARDLQG